MLSLTDLKPGIIFELDSQPYLVVFSQHSKLGRGGAIMRSKIKNLLTGAIIERTFKGSEIFPEIEIERKKAQYLYQDDKNCYFMDQTNFEQFSLNKEKISSSVEFLKEGLLIDILFYQNKAIDLQLPIKVTYEVTYTEPGFKGNTASTTSKPAQIETGKQIQVPLFIKTNDQIIVDTRTGSYVERK